MKVLANRHVGIIVHNFDRMLDFYIGLGLELRCRDIEKGQFVERLLNADNIILETAKLILQDESVPIQHRFKHLKRLLNFFFSYDSKIQILVLDSTPKNIKKDNELIKLLKKNKVEYIQYSEDTRISIKIDNGLKNVKTKYATLCSDDDYLIPGCLSKCINFLEVNNDYTSTLGITCIHNLTTESKFIMAHLYTRAKSLMKKSARERFLDVYI